LTIAALCFPFHDGTLKLSNMVNNMRVVLATQVAEVRIDRPSAPVPLAGFTPHSADGDYYYSAGDIGVAALVAGQTFIRFGLSQTVSSAPNTGRADANLQVASRQLGRLIAPWSGHLVATTTTSQFVPIARWMPAPSVVTFAGTYILTSVTGNFQMRLTYRTAATSPDNADAWASGFGSFIPSGEDNTGELTPTTTGKMWIQLGVEYSLSAGTTPGNADLMVLVGIREAS
jgi:hypothetical protein